MSPLTLSRGLRILQPGWDPLRIWVPMNIPFSLSLSFPFLSPLSVCKIMNSQERSGWPSFILFSSYSCCEREREGGADEKDEPQNASNIIETEIETFGPHCPVLVYIMDEAEVCAAPSPADEGGKRLTPGLQGWTQHWSLPARQLGPALGTAGVHYLGDYFQSFSFCPHAFGLAQALRTDWVSCCPASLTLTWIQTGHRHQPTTTSNS